MMKDRPKNKAPRPATKRPAHKEPRATKAIWEPGTVLWPVPVVMVSCVGRDGRPNIITIAWTGTICSEPPMLSISVRRSRHSYQLITESRDFVVNIPSEKVLKATDNCGVVSGRDVDKFEQFRLTPALASKVKAPIIVECPINIECVVHKSLELGSHVMFLAEIVAVQVTADLLTPSGRLAIEKAGLVAYAHNEYFALGKKLGYFGYSVRKRGKK